MRRIGLLVLVAGCSVGDPAPDLTNQVVFFVSTECPLSNRQNAAMGDLAREFPALSFLAVYPNDHETDIEGHAKRAGFPFASRRDAALAGRLKIEVTPTACLFDREGRLVYRGRIDELRAAIVETLAGKPVSVPETAAKGCRVKRPAGEGSGDVTYSKQVAPILRQHCANCHREGNIAPFALETYAQARAWAPEIRSYALTRRMPPWKPKKGDVAYFDSPTITDEEIAMLAKWADAGAPRGDAADEPKPLTHSTDWLLGMPDAVFEPPEEYVLSERGPDEYRMFVFPTDYGEDRWVSAVEYRAGNPAVVHHVFVYIDKGKAAQNLDARDPAPGFSSKGTGPGFIPSGDLGGWAPGMIQRPLPEGTAFLLPKGATIAMEVHYHKSGRVERDRTRIGLHFAKAPVRKQVRSHVVINFDFEIPPGAERHEVNAGWKSREDVHILAIVPHMHLLGREILVDAVYADQSKKRLIHIAEWDFYWQQFYWFREPVAFPKGAKMSLRAWFDNSAGKGPIGFGEDTTDEMAVAFLLYTRDDEDLSK